MERLQYGMFTKKLKTKFEFPEVLDMSEYVEDSLRNDCKYELKAIVMHQGSAHFGHYYALIKDDEDDEEKW